MTTLLRVLLVEDSEDDAQLILHQLRRGCYDPRWERVATPEAMTDSLNREQWDVILCDYQMPRFSAPAALKLVREREIDIPFIIVSGKIGEDTAVAMMKAGTHDYLMKDKLAKLVVAIEREMREARIRQERKRADVALRESEARYRALFEHSADGILIADLETKAFKYANPAICRMLGYTEEELRTMDMAAIHPKENLQWIVADFEAQARGDKKVSPDIPCLRKDGTIIYADVNASGITIGGWKCSVGFFRDITERKRAEEARRQAEANFRRSIDESPLGIRVVSAKGETLYANQAILDIYGYKDIEEMRSTPLKNRYTPESYAEYQSRKKKRMNGEVCSSEYEINILRKTGEIRRLRVIRKDISWNGQKHFQTIYQDITEQKKAEENLRETLGGLREALGGIIQVLSSTTEKRDPYTAGHQRRVADLARAIGREMGLDTERVEGLRLTGTIHDIGKIAIPAEILSKPGSLTETELKLIQTHPEVGHDILGDINFSWPVAEIVLQHHERMNGSGYPAGLKGDDILLEARILCVSDVVEAMASHRPYRPALGIEAAIEEIERNKGVLYDPEVVAACLKLFREKDFKFKS
ncbi:MAG: PAS domain S-box protein [Candidatus Aminicenantes bacterium]|nr:PAS domain S-box protein [Candidatus Aminicenantes bacterium]